MADERQNKKRRKPDRHIDGSAGIPTKHAGGGDYPAFKQSPFQRIVDVNWGGAPVDGAIFVSGDRTAQIRYAKMDKKDSPQDWIGLGDITDYSGAGQILSGSYAKIGETPTFVMGGTCIRGGDPEGPFPPASDVLGVIVVSHDGIHWSDALLQSNASVNALVWDIEDEHFYADVHDYDEGELPHRSPDGIHWTPVTDGTFLSDHCHSFYPYEDGWYGYDANNDLLIEPYGDGQVRITTDASTEDGEVSYAMTGLYRVQVVGYAGGIWVAGGDTDNGATSCTATSIDNGKTWTVVSTGKLEMDWEAQIEVVLGAPIEDFSLTIS